MPLTKDDGNELIKLAKLSIESYFSGREIEPNVNIKKKFSSKRGVFVTLNINKDLRGCIGYPEPIFPLYKAIVA